MRRRVTAILLSATLALGLMACGSGGVEHMAGEGSAVSQDGAEISVPRQEALTENNQALLDAFSPKKTSEDLLRFVPTPTPGPVTSTPTPGPVTSTPTPGPAMSSMVFRACFGEAPDSLDPALTGTRAGMTLAVNTFAGLYTLGEAGEIIGALAMGQPVISEDGLVYTFRLRRSAWSDGSPLTAEDFVYSWNRAAREETGAPYGYLLTDNIARGDDGQLMAEAVGERRLRVTLRHPAPYFTSLLAMPVFFPVPRAAVEAADPEGARPGAWTETALISNGAFLYEGMEGENVLLYKKNPAFYNARQVTPEALSIFISKDEDAAKEAYDDGALDYMDQVPAGRRHSAKEIHSVSGAGTYYLLFNPGSEYFAGMSNWTALTFRKAISLLIGRKAVARTQGGGALPADSLIPPGMRDGNGAEYKTDADTYLNAQAADIDRAKELLQSCGYSFSENEDQSVTITPALSLPYLTDEGEGHLAVAETLKEQLGALGITLAVTSLPWDAYYSALTAGQYVLAREGWPADYDDPMSLLGRFSTEAASGAHLGRTAAGQGPDWAGIDALLREIKADPSPESRVEKMHRAEKAILESWCVVPLYYYRVRYLLRPAISHVWCSPFGCAFFMYAKADEEGGSR